ncbi:MAG TPA: PP2C family protein-serine/threonine phosphatase [Thermoanaerobaculia bacterium]|nr:PP2C family protein-serine/threonine phosphatase [Thermoanaerobaculia bacterium]
MAKAKRRPKEEREKKPSRPAFAEAEGFIREYTAGMSRRELRRLFSRDATRAYEVLTRERRAGERGRDPGHRFIEGLRLAFLGLSYKLTPARRFLFAASLLSALLTLIRFQLHLGGGKTVTVDFGGLSFFVAIAGLCLLVALELVDRMEVRDELEVARELQASLLPREIPHLPGYRFAHSYRTAREVGGDAYDVCRLPDGRLALMVCDATGHGMAAGLVMAIAHATIGTALDLDPSPAAVAALIHRALRRKRRRHAFLTLFYALLDPETGCLSWVSAGHPFPLLRRANGTVEEIGSGSLPLGASEIVIPPTGETRLDPGDLLILYTDGLPEATTESGFTFGYDRLNALVRLGGPAAVVHERIARAFAEHVTDEPLMDDMTLLAVGRDGAEAVEVPPPPTQTDPGHSTQAVGLG